AAIALGDPIYLSLVDAPLMRTVVAEGVHGTSMPAFARRAGGMLTDKQIDVIVDEMRSRWARPGVLDGLDPPSYAARSTGNVAHGEMVYGLYCSSCHGP